MNLDETFFHVLTRTAKLEPVLEAGITKADFEGNWKKVFQYVLDYYNNPKFKGKIPTARALEHKFSFYSHAHADETIEFLCEKLEERTRTHKLTDALASVAKHLKQDSFDIEAATQAYLAGSMQVAAARNGKHKFLDLTQNTQDRLQEYEQRKQGINVYGTPSGIIPLDRRTLGFHPGEFGYILGRTGKGKSWMLEKMAQTAHSILGRPILVLPLEMNAKQWAMRHDALKYKVSYPRLRRGKLTPDEDKRYVAGLKSNTDQTSFIIASDDLFEGGRITPLTLRAKVSELNIGAVFVDGLYMMDSDNDKLGGWERYVDVGKNFKRMLRSEGIFGVATNQLNNDETAEDATIENQRYGNFGQYADVAIKIHQTADERMNHQLLVWILKLREDAVPLTPFPVHWDFDTMTLGEGDYDPEIEEEDKEEVPF